MDRQTLKNIIEAGLLAAGEPLSLDRLIGLFPEEQQPERDAVRQALDDIRAECEGRSLELKEVGSGFRLQVKAELAPWISRLWEERPARYSRALLETLALIAYRQPITRAEIEDIRGVSVSSNIVKTLQEREWVRVVGHRDVPGKPAMYATTREFLDYFNLKSLDELPPLAELRDIDSIEGRFGFPDPTDAEASEEGETTEAEASADAASEDGASDAEAADPEAGGDARVGDAWPDETGRERDEAPHEFAEAPALDEALAAESAMGPDEPGPAKGGAAAEAEWPDMDEFPEARDETGGDAAADARDDDEDDASDLPRAMG